MSAMNETDPNSLSRRAALRALGGGLGAVALRGLAGGQQGGGSLHHIPRAKRVIFLCMAGAPSHVDTFDHKPALAANSGKTSEEGGRRGASLLGSPWRFSQHGESGLWISELFPGVARHADKLCLLRGMHTEVPAHSQAFLAMHTGSTRFVRPSMGAWSLFGLGTENTSLPGFVTINPPSALGGAQNYGSAFLPSANQGQRIGIERESRLLRRGGATSPVANITNLRYGSKTQRRQLDLTRDLNESYARKQRSDADTIGAITESYELAFRMQAELPDLLDLTGVDDRTAARYGIGSEETDGFARQCLYALRMAESGVRFIEVNQGGWDHHFNLREELPASCRAVDRPIAALLEDLERTGLLEETLVVWGGEFGRTPHAQNGNGRDHNNRGFTTWMAGGGVRGGMSYGATDELGYEAVEGRVSIHDWHATILHILGLDHEQLTYPYAGRDFRLTDVHGRIVQELLA